MADRQPNQPENRHRPTFTVQDEIKRDRRLRRNARIRKARANAHKAVTALLLTFVLLVTVTAVLFAFMRVENVTVSGNVRYSTNEIIKASKTQDAILPLLRTDSVEKSIVNACPYVNSIELVKAYPNSLEIVVSEAEAIYTTLVRDRQYSLDADLRVIDFTESKDGLIELVLPEVVSAVEGSRIVFYDKLNDERVPELLEALLNDVNSLPLTSIDLSNRFGISAIIEDSVKINFGDYNDIPIKLNAASQLIEKAEENKSHRTLINVFSLSGDGPSIIFDYEGEF